MVVLARDASDEDGAWASAERRLERELALAGHAVVVAHTSVPALEVPDALAATYARGDALAAVALYVDGAQPVACVALADEHECRPIDAAEDAEAVLVVVEWLHARLLTRGLWRDPSAPPAPPEPPRETEEPPVPPAPETPVHVGLELLGGAQLALDDAAPFGVLALRLWVSPVRWLALAVELDGSVVPRTFEDARGRALAGIGSARVRGFADLLDDAIVSLGPTLGVGVLVAIASATASAPWIASSSASAAFVVDGGARTTFTLGRGVWLGLEARVHWISPLAVRFGDEPVMEIGGPGFAAEIGFGVRI